MKIKAKHKNKIAQRPQKFESQIPERIKNILRF